ncbi:MAG: hypothetical protein KZQ77_13395 [Candidatus Thiodiazotropha sp. (ex Notomyrtea botanica)]|nr:hypothetical protein [Candidatus Thiodiazotropha sp. (ex Notomyrtea botanica)]
MTKDLLLSLFFLALLTAILSPFFIQQLNNHTENLEGSLALGIFIAFLASLLIVSLAIYLSRIFKQHARVKAQEKLLVHLRHPRDCFCKLSFEELEVWFKRRYVDKIPTIKLLEHAANDREREAISAIAMLDLDEETMLSLMGDVDMPYHHIIHCRAQFLDALNKSVK